MAKLYSWSLINNYEKEGKTVFITEDELEKHFLKSDLPKRRLSSKTLTVVDNFSHGINYNTITRLS